MLGHSHMFRGHRRHKPDRAHNLQLFPHVLRAHQLLGVRRVARQKPGLATLLQILQQMGEPVRRSSLHIGYVFDQMVGRSHHISMHCDTASVRKANKSGHKLGLVHASSDIPQIFGLLAQAHGH